MCSAARPPDADARLQSGLDRANQAACSSSVPMNRYIGSMNKTPRCAHRAGRRWSKAEQPQAERQWCGNNSGSPRPLPDAGQGSRPRLEHVSQSSGRTPGAVPISPRFSRATVNEPPPAGTRNRLAIRKVRRNRRQDEMPRSIGSTYRRRLARRARASGERRSGRMRPRRARRSRAPGCPRADRSARPRLRHCAMRARTTNYAVPCRESEQRRESGLADSSGLTTKQDEN